MAGDRKVELKKKGEEGDHLRKQPKWYHYIEVFLLQGPILFPAVALDVSGPWKDALLEVAVIDLIWILTGFVAFRFLSKWVGFFVIGWVLVATFDFVFFGKRLTR